MFTELSNFIFRPTRAMLEEQIHDLTERLRRSEVQRKLMEDTLEHAKTVLRELEKDCVFVRKQCG